MFYLEFDWRRPRGIIYLQGVNMAIVLLIKTEDGEVTELPILKKTSLGRSSKSDYKITDAKISSTHCFLEVTKSGELLFRDLDSTNGSFLNNSRIHQSVIMKINDVIQIGNTLIKIFEKALTPAERVSIGSSNISDNSDEKSIPNMTQIGVSARTKAESADNAPIEKRRAIVLDKNIKEKKPAAPHSWAGVDNVLDQEASTGNTRFLKLDKKKKK